MWEWSPGAPVARGNSVVRGAALPVVRREAALRPRRPQPSPGWTVRVSQKSRLVHIVDDVPELDAREPGEPLTMVLVLDGFLDAGNAAARAAQHLVDLSDGPVVATFA